MSRHPADRYNDEFLEALNKSGLTYEQAADVLNVSLHTILAWLKPKTTRSSCACPRWRVELFRIAALDAIPSLTDDQRREIVSRLTDN